ncbi:MmgE/PrpD family protein [Chloroflexota bacterium]
MVTISESLADWVRNADLASFPGEIVHIGKRSILDFVGVALNGSRSPVAQIVQNYLGEVKGPEQSTVLGLGEKTSCMEAALANGLFGHCLDFDDTLITTPGGGGGHVSAAVFPGTLAVAEKENSSGKELLEAFILGCEVFARVGRGIDPEHYLTGWHATATEGVVGAAAAASRLLGLGGAEMSNALGIAASEASGLRENFGTLSKPFHAGEASAKGIKAALLAKFGLDSSRTIFEGQYGYCNVLSTNPKPGEILNNLGQLFWLPQIRLKLYPCCACSHAAIYSTLEMVCQHDINMEDVEKIDIDCDPFLPKVLVYDAPKTPYEGKFSMQYPIALAVSEREVTLEQFTEEKITEPGIVNLMQKVKQIPNQDLIMENPSAMSTIVNIHLKDGKIITKRYDFPPGTAENPISDEDLFSKYRKCARTVLPEKQVEESLKLIMNLEKVDNISLLMNAIRPES